MQRQTKRVFLIFILTMAAILFWSSYPKVKQKFFVEKKVESDYVSVRGVHSEKMAEENKNLAFRPLLLNKPDSPQKKMDFGNFYVRADSAIAIDAKTGTILHYQNAGERRAVASLTKVMTAIVVLENIDNLKEEIVTVGREAVLEEGTKIGCPRTGYCVSSRLRMGEKISAWNLFRAMVMNSTNDAAVALGNHIAGSQQDFAKMMNKKSKDLGLKDTHFCNPSGLDEENRPGGCYSTAHDMAKIAAYSLQYDEIWDTMKIQNLDIYSADKQITHHLINTDLLINQMPNCMGGKTGFTYEAGKSLMTGAYQPGNQNNQIIAVILNDYYRWQDMKNLIKWTFQAWQWP